MRRSPQVPLRGRRRRLSTALAFQWSQRPLGANATAPEAGPAGASCSFWVQPLVVVDNSAFSPGRLTALLILPILASQGRSPRFPFQTARILMVLHLFVFVLLLVVCLLLLLVRLGRLDWFNRRPSSSWGEAKRSTTQRLLKPRCPDDCPACRLTSPPSSGRGPAPVPVRPWREVKSWRGAPKRIDTEGYACPNPQCRYFGNTDAHFHAAFGRWQAWPGRTHPDVSLSGLPHHLQCSTRHAFVPVENPLPPGCRGAGCAV
jgi:hypothetical protein